MSLTARLIEADGAGSLGFACSESSLRDSRFGAELDRLFPQVGMACAR